MQIFAIVMAVVYLLIFGMIMLSLFPELPNDILKYLAGLISLEDPTRIFVLIIIAVIVIAILVLYFHKRTPDN